MGVRPAEPERRYGRSSWTVVAWPRHVLGGNEESRRRRIYTRIPLGEVQVRRNATVLHGERGLDEPRNACRRLEVPDVGLRRSQRAGLCAAAIRLCERLELDRITEHGAGPVGLDVVHRVGGHVARAQRCSDHVALGDRVGCGHPVGSAVLVDGRAPYDRQHPVAFADGVHQSLEHYHSAAFATDETVCGSVERLAPTVRGQ